jgi:wyosine [tRNA(Phe)-imidazoG37] synthetase (radical SAM superfamily)
MSLGIDPLSTDIRYCNFACPYCQLGMAGVSLERKVFISPEVLADEIRALPADCKIDYFTFSGNGEPTLAANLGQLIAAVKAVRPDSGAKVAIITNSTTVNDPAVQADLRLADLILFKIDAPNQEIFQRINHPAAGLKIDEIIQGIKDFKKIFDGKLALQIMFTGVNKGCGAELAKISREIGPDEVQINTPLRPSPVRPLLPEDMAEIKKHFVSAGLNVLSVYEEEKKQYSPFDDRATEKRHGRYREKKG